MGWLVILVGSLVIILAALQFWRVNSRPFRGEVIIENLRLWREILEARHREHPDDPPALSVAEEAVYMAQHSKHRRRVLFQARANVKKKKMQIYIVKECPTGPESCGEWVEILANSELEAAQKLCGKVLQTEGMLGELRARVRLKGDPSRRPAIAFYRCLTDSN